MNRDGLIELRNKVIHIYQAVIMMESGGSGVESGLELMKNASKSLLETLDVALCEIEIQNNVSQYTDSLYESICDPLQVDERIFREIESFLSLGKSRSVIYDNRLCYYR